MLLRIWKILCKVLTLIFQLLFDVLPFVPPNSYQFLQHKICHNFYMNSVNTISLSQDLDFVFRVDQETTQSEMRFYHCIHSVLWQNSGNFYVTFPMYGKGLVSFLLYCYLSACFAISFWSPWTALQRQMTNLDNHTFSTLSQCEILLKLYLIHLSQYYCNDPIEFWSHLIFDATDDENRNST